MFLTHLSQITTLLMAAICLWGLALGHWPERITAVAFAANWIGSALWEDRRPAHHLQPAWLTLDVAFLAVILALTLACRRTWLMWTSACTLLAILTHFVVLLDLRFGQWSYLTAYYIWSMGALAAFAAGIALEGRRPVAKLISFV